MADVNKDPVDAEPVYQNLTPVHAIMNTLVQLLSVAIALDKVLFEINPSLSKFHLG